MKLLKEGIGRGRVSWTWATLANHWPSSLVILVALTVATMTDALTTTGRPYDNSGGGTNSTHASDNGTLASPPPPMMMTMTFNMTTSTSMIDERARLAVDDAVILPTVLGCIEDGYPLSKALCYPFVGKCGAAPLELWPLSDYPAPPRPVCLPKRHTDPCQQTDNGSKNCWKKCRKFEQLNGECREHKCHCFLTSNSKRVPLTDLKNEHFGHQLCTHYVGEDRQPICAFACPNRKKGYCSEMVGADFRTIQQCVCPDDDDDDDLIHEEDVRSSQKTLAEINELYPPTTDPCEIDGLTRRQLDEACSAICPREISRGQCVQLADDETGDADKSGYYCLCFDLNAALPQQGVSPYFSPVVVVVVTAAEAAAANAADDADAAAAAAAAATTADATNGQARILIDKYDNVFHFDQPCHGFGNYGFSNMRCHKSCPQGTKGKCRRLALLHHIVNAGHCICHWDGVKRQWTLNVAWQLFQGSLANGDVPDDDDDNYDDDDGLLLVSTAEDNE